MEQGRVVHERSLDAGAGGGGREDERDDPESTGAPAVEQDFVLSEVDEDINVELASNDEVATSAIASDEKEEKSADGGALVNGGAKDSTIEEQKPDDSTSTKVESARATDRVQERADVDAAGEVTEQGRNSVDAVPETNDQNDDPTTLVVPATGGTAAAPSVNSNTEPATSGAATNPTIQGHAVTAPAPDVQGYSSGLHLLGQHQQGTGETPVSRQDEEDEITYSWSRE
ncbi:unnamed protein product, partial [Amoebophrya sp. A25]|eukprot:GSA25T00002652001.1